MIPVSAQLADLHGRRITLILVSAGILLYGFVMPRLFAGGTAGVVVMFILGFALMGLTYGPLGTLLSELYPVAVRYTGASVSFSMAGILGASLAPYAATWLASTYGLAFVGYYLSVMALISLIALALTHETRSLDYGSGRCSADEAS
jgi:MFS family permease